MQEAGNFLPWQRENWPRTGFMPAGGPTAEALR